MHSLRKDLQGGVPEGCQVGYGPRLTGLIGELSGAQCSSRNAVKEFCQSVLVLRSAMEGSSGAWIAYLKRSFPTM